MLQGLKQSNIDNEILKKDMPEVVNCLMENVYNLYNITREYYDSYKNSLEPINMTRLYTSDDDISLFIKHYFDRRHESYATIEIKNKKYQSTMKLVIFVDIIEANVKSIKGIYKKMNDIYDDRILFDVNNNFVHRLNNLWNTQILINEDYISDIYLLLSDIDKTIVEGIESFKRFDAGNFTQVPDMYKDKYKKLLEAMEGFNI